MSKTVYKSKTAIYNTDRILKRQRTGRIRHYTESADTAESGTAAECAPASRQCESDDAVALSAARVKGRKVINQSGTAITIAFARTHRRIGLRRAGRFFVF